MAADEPNQITHAARLRLALDRELTADEQVCWHGWQLARIDPRHFAIYLFAVPWTAFAVMWTVLASGAIGAAGMGVIGIAFPLFGVPFIAVGGWMLARPFAALHEKGRVLYVVTNARAMKLTSHRRLTVKSVPGERMGLTEKHEQPDGSGTLSLAINVGRDSDGDRQTEFFVIGPVDDIIGAARAVALIAAHRGETAEAGSLSS